ncbi:MAG: Chromosome segregation protein Spo0J [Bacteroidetes bacterium]|jgi:ParB family transcriptional regulator, chromosome partitioning protein|nr:Chromosome segregation protein Spo0J [Bacteroidota bacterium]
MTKKTVLGRGLDALITIEEVNVGGSSSINEIELDKIHPNPDQPRRTFDEDALAELSVSIKQLGIIQPIALRKISEDNYQIIAGERRFRASQLAGLKTIPAYVRTLEDEVVMEMALIENIQREDLNSIEIALAYQNLLEKNSLTQEQLSERIGKNRTTIANYVRLLRLPAEVQIGIKNKKIDMGHARTLVNIDNTSDQLELYELIIKDGLSVRKVEDIARKLNKGESLQDALKEAKPILPKKGISNVQTPEEFELLKQHLSSFFSSKVQFVCNEKGKGKITIPFKSNEELEKLIAMFDQIKR